MSEARHPFVTVRVRSEQLELAQLRLWELGATGLEERDQTTLVRDADSGGAVVIAAFPDEVSAQHALREMKSQYEAEILYVPQADWATEWRRGFGPQRIGKRLLLHPSWEPAESKPGDVVLTIDPENAFGSGDQRWMRERDLVHRRTSSRRDFGDRNGHRRGFGDRDRAKRRAQRRGASDLGIDAAIGRG